MAVTIISASKWDMPAGCFDVDLQPNHGCNLTTEGVLESLQEIENRPEMAELDRSLMASNSYLRGKERG